MRGFFFILIFSLNVNAQISVGLKESALGNSGVAFTDSSAPSHYNPALLSERSKNYFSITGTTLSSFKSSTQSGEFNSTKFAPNYISSIHAFENFVHEFSLVNQISLDTRISAAITDGRQNTNIRSDKYNLAYSFAFRDFPFGFQLGARINEQNVQLNQVTNDGNIARGVDVDTNTRIGHLFAGFGGIHQFGAHYRLGYKYETRGLKVYQKTDYTSSYYFYDKTNNLFSAGTVNNGTSSSDNGFNTQVVTIGHSFATGDHEFLTDSRFTENAETRNTFDYFQTFGYKINFANKMQFMTGASYEFESESTYVSSGFSWQTNTLRSIVSAYYADGKDESQMKSMGITFGSEYIY